MITLVSIRLRNFRKIREGTFAPLKEGVTGLSGANGAGKSSFLAAAIWALYGVRPDDVPTAGLRRQGTSPKDECSVSVLINHGGQTVEVIRELRGKNNKTIMNVFVDGKEQTVTTPTSAEKWVADRLKIDSDAFTTAFVVRQKELDSLVDARPAERRATIERLSGIDTMSAALKVARAEETDMKKEVLHMEGSDDDVSESASIVEEQKVSVEGLKKSFKTLKDQVAKLEEAAKASKVDYDNNNESFTNYTRDANSVLLKKKELENVRNLLNRAKKERESYEVETETPLSSQDLEDKGKWQASEKKEKEKTLETVQANSIRHESRVSSLNESLESARKEVASQDSRVKSLSVEPEKEEESLRLVKDKETEVSTYVDACSVKEGEKSSIERQKLLLARSVSMLDESPHDASCPTCQNPLDDPKLLIEDLRAQINDLDKQALDVDEGLEADQQRLNNARQELNVLRKEASEIGEERRTLQTVKDALKAASDRVVGLQGEIDKANNSKPAEGEISKLRDGIRLLDEKLEETRRLFQSARIAEKNKARYEQLSTEVEKHEKEVLHLEVEISDNESFIESVYTITQAGVEESRQKAANADEALSLARQQLSDADYQWGISKERLANAEREYTQVFNQFERKKSSLELLSQKAAVSDVLDEFRKDRIASIAPELSETATSLISAMTSGYYTEVLLDENFTPSVIDIEGNERPVSWLSGGEESVVALALRIAIGDLMTGGEGGLLWLDEVLTAQDTGRRSSLLNTLRNLTGRQIVMINHTPDASDMVDKNVEVLETDDGSILEAKLEKDEIIAQLNT